MTIDTKLIDQLLTNYKKSKDIHFKRTPVLRTAFGAGLGSTSRN